MTDRSAPSSDLEAAAALSHKLVVQFSRKAGKAEAVRSAPEAYFRFPQASLPEIASPRDVERVGGREAVSGIPVRATPIDFGEGGWNALLDEVLRISGGSAAFVADARALAVGVRGAIDTAEAESLAARMSTALSQLSHLCAPEQTFESLGAPVHGKWLGAYRPRPALDPDVTLCVMTEAPLNASFGTLFEELLRSSLARTPLAESPETVPWQGLT